MSRRSFLSSERMPAVAATYLLLLAFGYVLLVLPLQADSGEIARQVAATRDRLAELEERIEGVRPIDTDEPDEWRRAHERLLSRLAPEHELPLLIEALARIGQTAGVDVAITGEPLGRAPESVDAGRGTRLAGDDLPGLVIVTLHCRLVGPYAGVGSFVNDLGSLGWLIDIIDLDLAVGGSGVEARLQLQVWLRRQGDV